MDAVLAKLRQNSRQSLSKISRELGIPLTTLIKKMEKLEQFIIRHTPLLDFSKLGFDIRMMFFVKAQERKKLMEFLDSQPCINTVSELYERGFQFEALFSSMKEYYLFMEQLEGLGIKESCCYEIVEQLKHEEFLVKQKDL